MSAQELEPYVLREWDDERLDEYKTQLAYSYDEDERAGSGGGIAKLKYIIRRWIRENFGTAGNVLHGTIKLLLMLLVAAVIVYYIVKSRAPAILKRTNAKVDFAPENLDQYEEVDLKVLLQEAEASKNFQSAVRIRFLLLLKDLEKAKLIDWKDYKTNLDYYYEMQDPEVQEDFQRMMDWYEYSWYGKFDLDAPLYQRAVAQYTSFIQSLQNPKG